MSDLPDLSERLPATRRALHGVAELVMAGPQYRTSGTIRLRIVPGGFATVAAPELRVDADALITAAGARLPLHEVTYAALADAAGVDGGRPEGLYHDSSGADAADAVEVDPEAAAHLTDWLAAGDAALRRLAPGQDPVLWPEHFDLALTLDEVNYGVSPGDAAIGEPYAYVGPWRPHEGAFWNVSFGAARTLTELGGAGPDVAAGLAAFLEEGRRQAGASS
ncbi:hypothetical protein Pth03_07130 [Planotetraspora thailandica]|uniref:Uncharacterized protein n=1 Tax=Planotetraspora thailandica TaxID=487172 RepID=A0A8J3XTM0_9ACTN|nr:hypothetical protein [Planotetraspora thailandica]GII52324.1 hypothetical protein Pth03_07130 [Planotetraspora thailandica]